ncbi:MAG TPA: hypothetical protein VLH79_15720 [Chthonomonadales bacterium]|nr:hypothetical protein [Chthonomonadales bacterium]
MADDRLPERSLRSAFWLLAVLVLVLSIRGWMDVALGLAAGGAIGLSSLWSICLLARSLARPAAGRVGWVVALVLLGKLPIYGVALYYITQSPLFHPLAVVAGVAAVPAVIALRVIGNQLCRRGCAPAGEGACRSDRDRSN